MTTGLIIAPGLDRHLAEFSLQSIKPACIAFLCTEATMGVCHALAQEAGIPSEKIKICFIKDIFSSSETIQEFINAFEWIRSQGNASEVWIDATNCITVIEMASYLTASFIDLYREVLGEKIILRLAYVHAQYSKTESGVYAEVPGTERLVELEKPVDSLSFVLLAQATRSFNRFRLEDASEDFSSLSKNSSGERHIFYHALYNLSCAYERWDKMDFEASLEALELVLVHLGRIRGIKEAKKLAAEVAKQKEMLTRLIAGDATAIIADLMVNAQRRETEGRCDDALARLYACAERMIQTRLQKFGIETKAPDYQKLSEEHRTQITKTFSTLPRELELKKAAYVLSLLQDPVGQTIDELGFRPFTGLIGLRNESLLAHGTKPITKENYKKFKTVLFDRIALAFWGNEQKLNEAIEGHKFIQLTESRALLYQEVVGAAEMIVDAAPAKARQKSSLLH